MKEIIRHHLITEGRLEDVKNQYTPILGWIVDELSKNDPSGSNKYLPWMMRYVYNIITNFDRYDTDDEIQLALHNNYFSQHPGIDKDIEHVISDVINCVKDFHRYSDRLTPERVYEAYTDVLGYIPSNHTITRTDKTSSPAFGIHNSRDINEYRSIYVLQKIIDYIKNKYPSKGEIEKISKKETVHIYEDDIIKIVAPTSFASSCMYGAGTRWCTTSRMRPEYFNIYTKKNQTLIYFLFKKPMKNGELYFKSGKNRSFKRNNTPFKKMALHVNLKYKLFNWFDESDDAVDGLRVLKAYLDYYHQEDKFSTIKNKINEYLKTKDERSSISKFFKPRRVENLIFKGSRLQ